MRFKSLLLSGVLAGTINFSSSIMAAPSLATLADTSSVSLTTPRVLHLTGQASGEIVPPSISHGNVVFTGEPLTNRFGVYEYINGLVTTVADYTTTRPGQVDSFTAFGSPTISGSNVAFYGSANGASGIYKFSAGSLSRAADSTLFAPNSGRFKGFSRPAMDGNDVVFFGNSEFNQDGIYLFNSGSLSVLADPTTPVPSWSGTFGGLNSNVDSRNGQSVFYGSQGALRGIYAKKAGVVRKIADTNTTMPEGGVFRQFSNGVMATDGQSVCFLAAGDNGQFGIYLELGGVITRIASNGAPLGTFGVVSEINDSAVSIDGGIVTFYARTVGGGRAIYTSANGYVERVAGAGDAVDGKTVSAVYLSVESISDNQVAFAASFTDSTQRILVATLPEPGIVSIVVVGLLSLCRRSCHRRLIRVAELKNVCGSAK